jgi:hypothetical protein
MDPIEQAICLNNSAVNALTACEDVLAVSFLSNAIKLLQQAIPNPRKMSVGSEDPSFFLVDVAYDHQLTVEIPGMEQEQHTFIFNRAIVIPQLQQRGSYESEGAIDDDIQAYTAVIIFNLALSHHRRGMCTGESKALTKADKLYSLVLKLLAADDSNTSRMNVIVKLAAINNLAQLRFDAGDYEQGREGLIHLSSAFRVMSVSYLLNEEDLKDLLMSALLLRAPSVAPAA